jgi:hypothetical protein
MINSTFCEHVSTGKVGTETIALISIMDSLEILLAYDTIPLEMASFVDNMAWTVENCYLTTMKQRFPLPLEL